MMLEFEFWQTVMHKFDVRQHWMTEFAFDLFV